MKTRITLSKFFTLMIAMLALSGTLAIVFGAEGNPPPHVGGHAENSAAPAGANSLEGSIIAFATPLLVWGIRKLAPKIPKAWIPIIAGVLGFAIDQALPWISSGLQSTGYGFIAGLAGVGLRELKKQITTAATA